MRHPPSEGSTSPWQGVTNPSAPTQAGPANPGKRTSTPVSNPGGLQRRGGPGEGQLAAASQTLPQAPLPQREAAARGLWAWVGGVGA